MPILSPVGTEQTNNLIQNLFRMMQEEKLINLRGEENRRYLEQQSAGSMELEKLRSEDQKREDLAKHGLSMSLEAEKARLKEKETFDTMVAKVAADGDIAALGAHINWNRLKGMPVDQTIQDQYDRLVNGYVETIYKIGQGSSSITPEAARGVAGLSQAVGSQVLAQLGQTQRAGAELPIKRVEAATKASAESRELASQKDPQVVAQAKQVEDVKKTLLSMGSKTVPGYNFGTGQATSPMVKNPLGDREFGLALAKLTEFGLQLGDGKPLSEAQRRYLANIQRTNEIMAGGGMPSEATGGMIPGEFYWETKGAAIDKAKANPMAAPPPALQRVTAPPPSMGINPASGGVVDEYGFEIGKAYPAPTSGPRAGQVHVYLGNNMWAPLK